MLLVQILELSLQLKSSTPISKKNTNAEVIVPMNLPHSDKSGADQCCMAPVPIARLLDLPHGQGAPLQPMDVHPDQ